MGTRGHRPLRLTGMVIGILFAILKGFSPCCSANRAGLIVCRLCRTGRGSLEVLCFRSFRCEAVRCRLAVLLAADCADGLCRAGGSAAGVLGQLFAAGITQVVFIIVRTVAELFAAGIALMVVITVSAVTELFAADVTQVVVVIVRAGTEKLVTGITPMILIIVRMEHLAVHSFTSGAFMPMICIVAFPISAIEMAAKLAVLRFAFFADRSLHAVRRSAGAGFCHGVARITGADAGVRTVMVRRPITIVMTGGVFRGKGFGFDDLAARA